jgi:hypothetical protein
MHCTGRRPTLTAGVALRATQIPQTPPRVAADAVEAEQRATLDLPSTLARDEGPLQTAGDPAGALH